MDIKTGIYLHFKGKQYTVYGKIKTNFGDNYVLYRANYGSNEFWIRPVNMFFEKVKNNENIDVPRFKLVNKLNFSDLFSKLITELKNSNILIHNSETGELSTIVSINEINKEIYVGKYNLSSAYLTDTQLANRMGFDIYKINDKIIINKTCMPLLDKERFQLISCDDTGNIIEQKNIIKNQMNSCSIDLHISDEFYKSRLKKVDMSNVLQHATKPSSLWKRMYLKDINGNKGLVLWPNQSIITYTHETISLPSDCAGKIEIKSTYARLSLSVTTSDFCNPGWKGKYPLVIKNNGNHRIVIHPNEKMLQISLIPTPSIIINEYSSKGVFMDDDGTPFRFWRSQTVKSIGSKDEQKKVLEFYKNVLENIQENSTDIESEKERFEDTFLSYYGKKWYKKKYKNVHNIKEKLKLLWRKYKKRERTLKFFFSKPVKISTLALALLPAIVSLVEVYLDNNSLSASVITWLIIFTVLSVVGVIILFFNAPNCYCTLERLEFDKIYDNEIRED